MTWAIVRLAVNLDRLAYRIVQRALHLVRDQIGGLLLIGAICGVCWLLAARGLDGKRLALWLLVPVLFAGALVFLVGPDRLFPKQPYEGPHLLTLSENHAITLLDLPGVLCASTAVILGAWLIRGRLRRADVR